MLTTHKTKVLLLIAAFVLCLHASTAAEISPVSDKTRIADEERYLNALIGNLTHPSMRIKKEAIQEITRMRNVRTLPVFIDLMSAGDPLYSDLLQSLKTISGNDFGENWLDWSSWIHELHIEPTDDYDKFKIEFLNRLDPAFTLFALDKIDRRFPLTEIFWSGERKDAAPALNSPKMTTRRETTFLNDDDIVIGIVLGAEVRAYPVKILNWHLIVNDTVGPRTVVITSCPYSGTVAAYDSSLAGDRAALTFGFSGLVSRNTFLMYDRQENSLWEASTGRLLANSENDSQIILKKIPITQSDWKTWSKRFPDTLILDTNTGFQRNYDEKSPFFTHFADDSTGKPDSDGQDKVEGKQALLEHETVYGLAIGNASTAYLIKDLKEKGVVNEQINGVNFVLLFENRGNSIYAFERGSHTFAWNSEFELTDQDKNIWKITEDGLRAKKSNDVLKRIPGQVALLNAWLAWHPDSELKYE